MSEQAAATAAGDAEGSARRTGYMASTVKHGLIYFLGNVLSRLAGFIMLPVYTRVLTTGDYGILEILSLSTDILGMLAGLGIRQAVVRLYYQYDSTEDRGAVVSTASALLLGIFGTIMVVGIALSRPITDALLGADQGTRFVQLAITAFALGALGDVPGVYLQARQRSSVLVLANFVRLVLALGLNILFVVVLRTGVAGIFYSTILASVLVGGYMSIAMLRETGIRLSRRMARELVSFGSPLVAGQLGSFVLHFSDRYFLRYFHSLGVVGVYSLSYKFAMLIAMFVNGPFSAIWNAKALEIERREGAGAPPILRAILKQYNLVLVTAALGASLFSADAIHLILGREFHGADRPLPLLALAVVFFSYRNITQTGALIAKRPGIIGSVTSGAAVLALALNLLLIPRWEAMGAALATVLAFGAEFLVMLVLSERAYRIGITLGDLFAPLLIAAACWTGAALVAPAGAGEPAGVAVRVAAFAAYVGALAVTGILTPAARRVALDSVRRPRALLDALRSA